MTTYHVGFDLSCLIAMSDEDLGHAVKSNGASVVEVRTKLVCMRAAGKTHLAFASCTKQDSFGRCLGHVKEPEHRIESDHHE